MNDIRDMIYFRENVDGSVTPEAIGSMRYPMRHVQCGRVHDAAYVEVLQRYSDCSRWLCPHCGGWCDDRPIGWGGSVEIVTLRTDSGPR